MAKKEECKKGLPGWLGTYGDMVTLLLTFFVLLFSTTTATSNTQFRLILSAFKGSLGLFEGGQTLSKGKLEEMGMNLESLPSAEKGSNLAKANNVATEIFKPEISSKSVSLQQTERGLVISLLGNDNFAPGSAKLTEAAQSTLKKVADLLRQIPSLVRIEGHADEQNLISGLGEERYETNWELASQRAVNVLRYLHEKEDVEPEKMSAVSFGKYRPMSQSNTPEGRALNRRVDIFVLMGKQYTRGFDDPELPGKKTPGIEFSTP